MEEKSRSVRRSREDAEYGQRYAVEPTNNRFSSTQCDDYVGGPPLADKMTLRHLSYSTIPPKLATFSRTEADSVYEEIDRVPIESIEPRGERPSDKPLNPLFGITLYGSAAIATPFMLVFEYDVLLFRVISCQSASLHSF
uniref:Uncharacterized protein n=1 Tax=Parascaris equorum TaxID=6256 RepID=A0A914RFX2_PAREQ